MSLQGPLIVVADHPAAELNAALSIAGFFPIVESTWAVAPTAFVAVKPDAGALTEAAVIAWCRTEMAHFKAPRTVIFGPLPKTSTGKIQKFVLRDRAKSAD